MTRSVLPGASKVAFRVLVRSSEVLVRASHDLGGASGDIDGASPEVRCGSPGLVSHSPGPRGSSPVRVRASDGEESTSQARKRTPQNRCRAKKVRGRASQVVGCPFQDGFSPSEWLDARLHDLGAGRFAHFQDDEGPESVVRAGCEMAEVRLRLDHGGHRGSRPRVLAE
jgi:hypothetical protein